MLIMLHFNMHEMYVRQTVAEINLKLDLAMNGNVLLEGLFIK